MNREHAQRVLDHMSRDEEVMHVVIKNAMRAGYENAVAGLREMADHLNDEGMADVVRMLATALESMKP